VWDLTGGPFGVHYPWITSGPLHRTHTLTEIAPHLPDFAVDRLILVQASDSLAETDELLRAADDEAPVRTDVVGWLPLADAGACEEALTRRADARLVGVRHLIHDEPDTEWMLRPDVADGMRVLERSGLTFDAVAERPDLVAQIPTVAERHPDLTLVLDHLGKPPIASGWHSEPAREWAAQLREVSRAETVRAKISGLGTVSPSPWRPAHWQPFVDHALECFGPSRLMIGSDWPVSTLAGDYPTVMAGLLDVVAMLSEDERRAILGATAARTYS